MRSLDEYFEEYEEHHRSSLNKATHTVGIPLIVLALLGLAARVALPSPIEGLSIDLALVLATLLVAVYLFLHVGLALGVGVLLVPLYLAGASLSLAWLAVLLGLGLALQYLGHYAFEGRAPAFHQNAVHTLIGPIWTAALLFRALRLYRS